ncbi:MAG TPA: UvrD-helicase domain-containing protein, partial [Paludibacter sp.]|nr:UvrD-helicase domain-containing protein [Paludibacter sp.]
MLNIYRASAGSGKTYRLTQDYIHLLFDPRRERVHRRILAVTFTNKATDEMKSRILKELHALAQGEKSGYREGLMKKFGLSVEETNLRARKILINILHDYSSYSISTIDKFFQQIIRSFAREIGVQGGYNLELDNENILQQSMDNMFLDLSKTENRQLLNWLTQFAEDRVENSENWNPRRSIEDLGKEIFKENYQNKAEDISQ